MAESRNVRWDIAALGMFALATFVALSLWTHDPADPVGPLPLPLSFLYDPDQVAEPVNQIYSNQCGYWGALSSHALLHAVGIGAYLVAFLGFVAVIAMLRQQPIASPLGRSIGWSLVLLAVVTMPALIDWHLELPVAVGSGGYLGLMTSHWIHQHFALTGGLILTLSCFLAGLLLSTEYAVLRILSMVTLGTVQAVGKVPSPQGFISLLFSGWTPALASEANSAGDVMTVVGPQGTVRSDTPNRIRFTSDVDNMAEPSLKIRGKEIAVDPANPTDVAETKKKSPVAAAAAIASGIAQSLLNAKGNVVIAHDAEENEEFEEDEVESDEESESNVREVEVEGETIVAREDEPQGLAGPRVRNKTSRKDNKHRESLDHLDDTRLPEGSEEYVLPGIDLLTESDDIDYEEQSLEVRQKAKILEQTFESFGFKVKVVEIETGPVIAQYEIELAAGLRLSKISGLSDDLAIALRVPSVRIVAPIPGKNTVGIEVPNTTRQVVRMREVIEEGANSIRKMKIPLFLGKDVSGNPLCVDLAGLPHLLIAGRTGTGKSVCLNTIISSILMTRRPDEVRMLMIDPKMVELSGYGRLPHLMHPVVTDMRKAEAILAWAVDKMEERYALLARAGVRHITGYNQLGREELHERLRPESPEEAKMIPDHLPFIVIVADEMADLMMTAGKEVEAHIIRLAQKSRAIGIHLILATQKPTVDVITGLIKSNLPARISFQVASRTDSRVVLDEMGADKLLGNGDMLFMGAGTSKLLRGQGTYLSDDEINRVVDHCSTGEQNFVNELVNLKIETEEGDEPIKPGSFKKRDELYEAAVDVVVREGRGSCSLLQRALGIGYGRAARLIDFMAEDGIVGQYNGSQAREVVISIADWDQMRSNSAETTPKKNRISVHESQLAPNRHSASEWGDDEESQEEEDENAEEDEEEEEEEEYDESSDEGHDDEEDDEESMEYVDAEDEYEHSIERNEEPLPRRGKR